MRVELAYGRGALGLEILERDCAELRIVEKGEETPLSDLDRALRRALETPIEAPPLRALARGRRDAVIVISDRTRPVPNALLLPPLLDALREGGLPEDRVTLQVATGLHRACTSAELDEMLGAVRSRRLRIVQHDARDLDSHVNLGSSRSGVPILIDRFFLERDLRIATGLIEPHLMAGYSGGRKAICPGLAAVETIRVAHGAAMLERWVGSGIIVGNPLQESLLEIVRKVGVHFLVNVALDRRRRVSGIFCGDLEAAHAEGMRFVEARSHVALDRPADLVVVSGGGDPLDATFYQAIKGIVAAAGVVRPGGVILLVASLSEGIGSPSFEKCLRESEGPADFERRLEDDRFFAIDQWMVQHLCQVLRRAHVLLFSDGLDRATQQELFVEPVPSPEAGLRRALALLGAKPRTVVIPQGPYILATIRGEKRALGRASPP
ncbi:MAG TPA: nickel-dependent lactate racemase [Myxococcota bacterium]|nr:nickel-dependent lactate racemase [Myxococcota bacterium]